MLVLGTLHRGAQHGHGIGQEIGFLSAGTIRIESGSLYPALHRLETRGWLERREPQKKTNQRMKYYHLTAPGKAQLLRERRRWSRIVAAIESAMDSRRNSCVGF